jgi:hypothetical protein
MDEVIAQICEVPRRTIRPSERLVRQCCKDYEINSQRHKPATDAIRHAVIEQLRQVPPLRVAKERGTQPRNPEQNGKTARWWQSLGQVSEDHDIARLGRGYNPSHHTNLSRPQTGMASRRLNRRYLSEITNLLTSNSLVNRTQAKRAR